MIEINNIFGLTVIQTDKNIDELYNRWVKSLYKNSYIGKKLDLAKEFQFKILLGEYVTKEIYSYKNSPGATDEINSACENISSELGAYFDKGLFMCINCFENGLQMIVEKKEIDKLDRAIDYALDFFPNPEEIKKKFAAEYNLGFINCEEGVSENE